MELLQSQAIADRELSGSASYLLYETWGKGYIRSGRILREAFKKKIKSVDFSAIFLVGGIGWLEHFHPKILPLRACLDLDLDICYDQS